MKALNLKSMLIVVALGLVSLGYSQTPLQKLVSKKDKVIKLMDKAQGPYNCNNDGHGLNPYLTSKSQIPDTIALITFYVYDKGSSQFNSATYLTDNGSNYFATQLFNESIKALKETYKKNGIVLLTPPEYLNTDEKIQFYAEDYQPEISKLGNLMNDIETRHEKSSFTADSFRGFDIGAATDFKRSESLGSVLTNKLGVKGVLSIGIQLADDGKHIGLVNVFYTLNGPNPVPKQDKKYFGSHGAGYQNGLVYFNSYLDGRGTEIAQLKKGKAAKEEYTGFSDILSCFAQASVDKMDEIIEKNAK